MAKNGTKWIVGTVIAVATILCTLGGGWALFGAGIEGNVADIVELKEDGCKPAQAHTTEIAVMQTTQQTMQRDIGEIKVEQREFRAEQKQEFAEIKALIKEK